MGSYRRSGLQKLLEPLEQSEFKWLEGTSEGEAALALKNATTQEMINGKHRDGRHLGGDMSGATNHTNGKRKTTFWEESIRYRSVSLDAV